MRYRVETTFGDILTGADYFEAFPGKPARYEFDLYPTEMGNLTGILSFSGFEIRKENNPEFESDGEDEFGNRGKPELIEVTIGKEHLVKFELEIDAVRSEPVKEITFRCAVGEQTSVNLPLFNPTTEAELKNPRNNTFAQNLNSCQLSIFEMKFR